MKTNRCSFWDAVNYLCSITGFDINLSEIDGSEDVKYSKEKGKGKFINYFSGGKNKVDPISNGILEETVVRGASYFRCLGISDEIIKKSLSKYSAIIISTKWDKIIDFANDYAAEHLQLMVKSPWNIFQKIKNAGSIFIGKYAPVAIGDYASGTNHVLPTGQYAKMFSPVGVETFQKKSEYQYLTKNGIEKLEPIVKEI